MNYLHESRIKLFEWLDLFLFRFLPFPDIPHQTLQTCAHDNGTHGIRLSLLTDCLVLTDQLSIVRNPQTSKLCEISYLYQTDTLLISQGSVCNRYKYDTNVTMFVDF